MKSLDNIYIQALIMAIILTAPLLFAESGTGAGQLPAELKSAETERTSPEALAKLKAQHQKTQGFKDGTWSSTAPDGGLLKQDIYRNSVILQVGPSHTVLPPHSVMHLPKSLRKMVVTSATGDYVPWPEFCTQNRSTIITHSITLKQALGTEAIRPEVRNQLEKINRIVVALYHNNPISVLPAQ